MKRGLRASVQYDLQSEAWMVLVNGVRAITFVGEDAPNLAQNTATELRRHVEEMHPWLLHDTDQGDVA